MSNVYLNELELNRSWPSSDKPYVNFEYDGNEVYIDIYGNNGDLIKSLTIKIVNDIQLIIADEKRNLFNINSFTGKPYRKDKGLDD